MNLSENLFVDGWYNNSDEMAQWFGSAWQKLEWLGEKPGVIPIGVLQHREGGSFCLVYLANEPVSKNHILDNNSPIAHLARTYLAKRNEGGSD